MKQKQYCNKLNEDLKKMVQVKKKKKILKNVFDGNKINFFI